LVAWFVTSLVLGDELVTTLALAEYAPTSLGLQEGVGSPGEVGPRLGIAAFAAALVPATGYGDGLCGRWTGSPSGTGGPRGCGGGCWPWCSWPVA
jgi:hypothetical protein